MAQFILDPGGGPTSIENVFFSYFADNFQKWGFYRDPENVDFVVCTLETLCL